MNKDYQYDYLSDTDLYVYQHKELFHMNTDTALLAKFMQIKAQESIVDIGTNNGVLLIYAKRFSPARYIGIEIQKEACVVAKDNFKLHHLDVELYHSDVKDMDLNDMDVVVSNPPYFAMRSMDHINKDERLSIARHEVYLCLETLIEKASSFLKDYGRFYFVYRPDRLAEITIILKKYHLEPKKIQFVYDENKEDARTVLIEAIKYAKSHCKVMKPIILTRS